MKVEKSVSMHLHVLKRSYKRQIVPDTKSRNTSQMQRGGTENKSLLKGGHLGS